MGRESRMKWDVEAAVDCLKVLTEHICEAAEKTTKNSIQINGPPRRIELGTGYEAGIQTNQPRRSVCVCVYVRVSTWSVHPLLHFSVPHKRYYVTRLGWKLLCSVCCVTSGDCLKEEEEEDQSLQVETVISCNFPNRSYSYWFELCNENCLVAEWGVPVSLWWRCHGSRYLICLSGECTTIM